MIRNALLGAALAAALFLLFLFLGKALQIDDPFVVDECVRHERFTECMNAAAKIPGGNEPGDIIDECGDWAFDSSRRKRSTISPNCR